MSTLHLIRHARPAIDPAVPPPEWGLAPGETGCSELRPVLPEQARWFSSPEPKARQTAALLTDQQIEVVDSLREAGRDGSLVEEATFRAQVVSFLREGQTPEGWEPRVDVTLRIVDTALAVLAAFPGEDCVLVGHGTAFTLLVAALTGTKPDVDAWASLRMPDHCALELLPEDAFEVVSPWGSWGAGVGATV